MISSQYILPRDTYIVTLPTFEVDNDGNDEITDEFTEDEINDDEITDRIPEDEIVDDDNKETSTVTYNNNIDRFIDPLINDINRFCVTAELSITSGLTYGASSVTVDEDNDNDDSSEATTEAPTRDTTAAPNVSKDFDIDTLIYEFNKLAINDECDDGNNCIGELMSTQHTNEYTLSVRLACFIDEDVDDDDFAEDKLNNDADDTDDEFTGAEIYEDTVADEFTEDNIDNGDETSSIPNDNDKDTIVDHDGDQITNFHATTDPAVTTIDDYISNEYDEITDEGFTNIDDTDELVFIDTTNREVEIVFYETSSPACFTDITLDNIYKLQVDVLNVMISSNHGELISVPSSNYNNCFIGIDMDNEYELQVDVLTTIISSNHGELISNQGSNNNISTLPLFSFDDPHKEPSETDIVPLINDIDRLIISSAPLFHSVSLYQPSSPTDNKGIHSYDSYRIDTSLKPRNETGATGNDDTIIDLHVDTHPKEINKFFLSEATKENSTNSVITTAECNNYTFFPSYVHTNHESYKHKLHRWFTWRYVFSDDHFLDDSFQCWLAWKYVFSSRDILHLTLPDIEIYATVAVSDPSTNISLTFMVANENVYVLLMIINNAPFFSYTTGKCIKGRICVTDWKQLN